MSVRSSEANTSRDRPEVNERQRTVQSYELVNTYKLDQSRSRRTRFNRTLCASKGSNLMQEMEDFDVAGQ